MLPFLVGWRQFQLMALSCGFHNGDFVDDQKGTRVQKIGQCSRTMASGAGVVCQLGETSKIQH